MPLASATPAPAATCYLLANAGIAVQTAPVFLTFFRIDCPWCVSELPRLAEMYNRRSQLKFHVVGVVGGTATEAENRAFAEEKGWGFPIVADPDLKWHHLFEVERVPTIVLIDADGNIERSYEGASGQLVGILDQTIYSAVHRTEPPSFNMVGNGCAP